MQVRFVLIAITAATLALTACGEPATEDTNQQIAVTKPVQSGGNGVPADRELSSEEVALLQNRAESLEAYARFTNVFSTDQATGFTLLASKLDIKHENADSPLRVIEAGTNVFGPDSQEYLSRFMRSQLNSPAKVRAVYSALPDSVFRSLVQRIGLGPVTKWQKEAQVIADKPFDPELTTDFSDWFECRYASESEFCSYKKAGHDRFVEGFKKLYGIEPTHVSGKAYGFLARRYSEGGAKLVQAWQAVAKEAAERVD